jgi:hypothetical protein
MSSSPFWNIPTQQQAKHLWASWWLQNLNQTPLRHIATLKHAKHYYWASCSGLFQNSFVGMEFAKGSNYSTDVCWAVLVTIVSVNPLRDQVFSKVVVFPRYGLDHGGTDYFFLQHAYFSTFKGNFQSHLLKKNRVLLFFIVGEGRHIKYWMRKSKAWYRQVADSKANRNIYNRSVQFEDPLDLWCHKPF